MGACLFLRAVHRRARLRAVAVASETVRRERTHAAAGGLIDECNTEAQDPRQASRQSRHHRPRVGWHPGTQYAAAALVAVAVLRDDHLVARVLGRLSGVAACLLLQQRPVPLEYA